MASHVKRIAVLASLMFASSIGFYVFLIYFSPISISVIDRDNSGFVSLFEAIGSYDVGRRPSKSTPGCTEIFWLKDGLPATLECP
jgi:hypothetical protein